MIRSIVAVDEKRGMADDRGIPWQGKVPGDVAYFRKQTLSGDAVLMGYGTYTEFSAPLPGRANYVATHKEEALRDGFIKVHEAREFLQQTSGDIWNIGGARLFEETLDLNDELYITKLRGDFGCTKFFPEYEDLFELASESEPVTENDITYTFCVYKKRQ